MGHVKPAVLWGTPRRTSGMTRIRARCPGCGDVEFSVDDIVVLAIPPSAGAYRFTCPSCGDPVSRTAGPDVIELLLSAGVRRERFEHPSLMSDERRLIERQFTERDIAEFRELLTAPDWFDRLQAAVDGD